MSPFVVLNAGLVLFSTKPVADVSPLIPPQRDDTALALRPTHVRFYRPLQQLLRVS